MADRRDDLVAAVVQRTREQDDGTAGTRTEMTDEDRIDCRKLARALAAQRAPASPEMVAALRARFGIDPALTLTEIEGIDCGDAIVWGDLPDLHALRYIPLSLFTPADIELLLAHRESIGLMMPMARLVLESEPLIAAQNFEGDLLLTLCACVAGEAFDHPVHVPTPFPDEPPEERSWAMALVDQAEASMWAAFAKAADGRNEKEFVRARRAVCWGPPLLTTPWYSPFDDLKNTLCEARAWLSPPRVKARAVVNALYAVPRNGRLQIVPPEAFEDMSATAEHSFERPTVFEILTPHDDEVPGVDLVSRAVSSIEDWRGTRCADVGAAMARAFELFGLPPALWDECIEGDEGPLNHYDIDDR